MVQGSSCIIIVLKADCTLDCYNGQSRDYTGLILEHLGKGLWGCACIGVTIHQVNFSLGDCLAHWYRVTGKSWQDVLTSPGWPLWRTTYCFTTSVWKMSQSWQWRLLAASGAWRKSNNNDDDDYYYIHWEISRPVLLTLSYRDNSNQCKLLTRLMDVAMEAIISIVRIVGWM